jgi:hypothetical protein
VMATTKSTVVGIRLDHERRAWVEAEAARLGVSVRGLFEGMIDGARSATDEPASSPEDSPEHPVRAFRSSVDEVEVPSSHGEHGPSDQQESGLAGADSASRPSSPGSFVPGVGMVAGIPGNILRGAFSLTVDIIESGGRCATKRLSSCVLTRRWIDRSL